MAFDIITKLCKWYYIGSYWLKLFVCNFYTKILIYTLVYQKSKSIASCGNHLKYINLVALISQMVERPMERWVYAISTIIHSSLIFVDAKSCMKIDLSIMSYKCSIRLMLGEWCGSTILWKSTECSSNQF